MKKPLLIISAPNSISKTEQHRDDFEKALSVLKEDFTVLYYFDNTDFKITVISEEKINITTL